MLLLRVGSLITLTFLPFILIDPSIDLHDLATYQASSIHSRRRSPAGSFYAGYKSPSFHERSMSPSGPMPTSASEAANHRTQAENRLLSDVWLTSAATFRRMGRIDQAKSAIMEAEVLDEDNPNVWTQVGPFLLLLAVPPELTTWPALLISLSTHFIFRK